jgi:glycosyltransferase involved in cell wall biosynthesis
MTKRPDLSLILACFNEAPHFADSLRQIEEVLSYSHCSYELLFVDDKSRDNTAELIKNAVKKHAHRRAIYHRYNMGRGRTVSDGIQKARGTIVGYIDIDCEVSPVYIPQIIKMMLENERIDVVIGHRTYRTSLASIIREVLSLGYQCLADQMVGTNYLDTESGYKFFRRKKIIPVLAKAKHPHWFWDTEIIVFARLAGLRVVEVPVLFLRNFDKKSTVRIIPDTIDYIKSLWQLWKRLL